VPFCCEPQDSDLQTALAIAEKYAPTVVINGFTPADLIEWRKTQPGSSRSRLIFGPLDHGSARWSTASA